MTVNETITATYVCGICDWTYDAALGDSDGGIDPGTPWENIADGWVCPVCGAEKEDFSRVLGHSPEPESSSVSEGFYLSSWEKKSDEREPEFRSILNKALSGEEELSSMRSPKWRNLMESIVFLPGQLARRPLDHREVSPNLGVVIGPKAAKPLSIDLPFYVSDMSFGALSKEAKIALARGAARCGTAIFGGEGGLLEAEYQAAHAYVFEYSTGRFGATEENLKKSHAIQIKMGQAAKAGVGGHLLAAKVNEDIVAARGVPPGTDLISPANHPDIHGPADFARKVAWLREVGEGVPVGVKIATGWIEADLDVALAAGVDFITLDARGGSTGAAPDHIKDNVCLPLPYALARARNFLHKVGKKEEVSLLVAGGVRTSGDIAKCLGLGANAVGLATTAMMGIGCQQYRVCHKGTCPVGIATQDPELRLRFNVEKSATMLANLFTVYAKELADFPRMCGKRDIAALGLEDLAALTMDVATGTGLNFAGSHPEDGFIP